MIEKILIKIAIGTLTILLVFWLESDLNFLNKFFILNSE